MTVLALESAAAIASVALTEDGKTLAELTLDNGNTHSETLLPMVDMLFRLTGKTCADVDLFAASVGPGSFTGIRIGAATVKGLAFGSGKCCLGVSSLEALAYGLRGRDGLVCPVLNARRRQVYTALFRSEGGKITRLTEDTVRLVDDLDAYLADYAEPVLFAGDASRLAAETVTHETASVATPLLRASAAAVAYAAQAAFERGARGTDATLSPVYLRPCQAERERLEKENRESPKPKD